MRRLSPLAKPLFAPLPKPGQLEMMSVNLENISEALSQLSSTKICSTGYIPYRGKKYQILFPRQIAGHLKV